MLSLLCSEAEEGGRVKSFTSVDPLCCTVPVEEAAEPFLATATPAAAAFS